MPVVWAWLNRRYNGKAPSPSQTLSSTYTAVIVASAHPKFDRNLTPFPRDYVSYTYGMLGSYFTIHRHTLALFMYGLRQEKPRRTRRGAGYLRLK